MLKIAMVVLVEGVNDCGVEIVTVVVVEGCDNDDDGVL